MNGISSWSIRNPVPTIVLFITLVYAGWQSYGSLRVNSMPDIDFPTVTVSVSQQGASPTELETQVTDIVEEALATVADVESVESTISEGSSVTTVEFDLSKDLKEAVSDIETQMNGIRSNLPAAADDPVVSRVNAGDTSIIAYALEAPSLDPDERSWMVDNRIAKAVLAVDGASKVTRMGGVERAVVVEVDVDALAAHGLTVSDLNSSLVGQNVNSPGGRAVVGRFEQSIRTLGRVSSLEELKALRIPLSGGGTVRLDEVSDVRDGWEEPRQSAKLDGSEVVAFEVYAAKGASQVHVAKEVRTVVAGLEGKLGKDVRIIEVTSSSDFVEESFQAAFEALWIGALLAVVVVWIFLRDWRATLAAATALPLSLIPTFAVMEWLGLSMNGITLLAISLVVGILVDDAIVEVENIVRHMRNSGKSAFEAAIEAADEIGLAVVATTFTIVAVFLPVSFMPGIPGAFFYSFAIVTCVSVLFSLLVARTFTPLLAANFVRASHHEEKEGRLTRVYLACLSACLRWRWVSLAAAVAFLAGSVSLASLLKQEFMVATDRGRTTVNVSLQPGSTMAQTMAAADRVYEAIKDRPEVRSVFVTTGGGVSAGGGPQGRSNRNDVTSATVTVNLVDRGERTISQQEFEAEVTPLLSGVPGARVRIGGGFSGESYSVTLLSEDSELLGRIATDLAQQMRSITGLSNPTSTDAATKPEITVVPDKALLAETGTNITAIASLLNMTTLGPQSSSAAKFNLGERQVDIIPILPPGEARDPDFVASIPVPTTVGNLPLGALAEIGYGTGPTSIKHVEGRRSVTVRADMRGVTTGDIKTAVEALPVMRELPSTVSTAERGDQKRMKELFSGFATAFATGVLLMYLTLVLLFRSFLQPLTILVALPLSIGGALGFMYVTGSSLAMTALIGILLLMGIAAKNSILLVEYAIMARAKGTERRQALMEAAAKRARPIIMTSIAMGAGMLPIALGIGADAESRAPMGIAVIGGLLSSTVLSLVFIPVVYTFVDDVEKFLGRGLSRLRAS